MKRRQILPTWNDFMGAVILSESANSKSLALTSWNVFAGAMVLTWLCLAFFISMQEFFLTPEAEKNGYKIVLSKEEDLKVLDRREGYSVATVAGLLTWYGTRGRLAYIVFEVVDMLFFQVGYRIAALVLVNNVVTKAATLYPTYASRLKLISRLPIYLAKVDVLENLFQIVVVLTFELNYKRVNVTDLPWFFHLVLISSTLNQAKWMLAKTMGVTYLVVLALQRVGSAALASKKKP